SDLQRDPTSEGVDSKAVLGVGNWVPVDEEKAASKVGHCLREKGKEKKGSNENEASENDLAPLNFIFEQPSPSIEELKYHHNGNNIFVTSSASSAAKHVTSSKELGSDTNFSTFNDDRVHTDENRFENSAVIPLRHWIESAITASVGMYPPYSASADGTRETSLTKSYIIDALNIAYSLADQLCDAQEIGNFSFLPNTTYDWANRVIVHRETSSACDPSSIHSEPTSAKDDSSSQDPFHALIDSIALEPPLGRDEIVLENGDSKDDFKGDFSGTNSIRPMTARLLPPTRGEEKGHEAKTEIQRIYLLGRVFYELFSGGEIPFDMQQNGNFNDDRQGNFTRGFLGGLKISAAQDGGRRENLQDSSSRNQRKKSRSCDDRNEILMAVDRLNLKGIPVPLCDMIGNMLDAIHGDLSRDEAYLRMADVREDLKLVLDKPSKYLQHQNIEILSTSGLKLPDTIYGQHKELKSLQECYYHSFNGNHTLAIIAGPSGTGKTTLANQFAELVLAEGGLFLSGKFDQLQQATPFSALSCAFNEYCNMLIGSVDSQSVTIASALRDALAQDAAHLIKVVPNLSLIMGDLCNVDAEVGCVDAQKRLQYLLCRFVEIISDSSSRPVVLFLDDVQWADIASINVIIQILKSSGSSRLLLVGSCRNDEMSDDHPIWNMISSVNKFGVNAKIIIMSQLDRDLVNEMLSDTLCLFPRVTRPLADILHHKTKGNPLFLSRLMVSLSKDGLLRFSFNRRRWEWDEEEIQSKKIPNDVAEFLTNSIGRLPPDVQAALSTLSCFGASTHTTVIEVLESRLDLRLKDSLEVATTEGFLEKNDETFQFSHDRVQEAAYNTQNSQDRRAEHTRYGFALCIHAMNGCNDSMLFTAVDQINRGDPSVIVNPEHRSLVATLNLQAGKKAMEMSDYLSALSFFEYGISFLQERHWQQDYELSLELFNCSTKSAYAVGDQDKLKLRSDEVLAFGRCFEDKLVVLYYFVSALCDACLLNEAIAKAIWVLSMLGEDLHHSSSRDTTLILVDDTKKMMIEVSDDALLNYSLMTESSKIMAMKFLSRLEVPLFMTNSDFFPIVVLQMVKLTLLHGMTPMSAIGFVYFGSMLASLGQLREGYRFANLAKKLVQRFGSKEMAGEVIAISSQTIGYIEPMQSIIQFHAEGHTTALEAGDIRIASLNLLLQCNSLVWSGSSLNDAKIMFDEASRFMKQHNVLSLLFIAETRELDKLINGCESVNSTDHDGSSEYYLQDKHPFAARSCQFQGLMISFIYRNFEVTKNAAERYIGSKIDSWVALNYKTTETFIL
ncbi:hypothetical protein ACHAXS_002187, partial [Conticribra weissflogii]